MRSCLPAKSAEIDTAWEEERNFWYFSPLVLTACIQLQEACPTFNLLSLHLLYFSYFLFLFFSTLNSSFIDSRSTMVSFSNFAACSAWLFDSLWSVLPSFLLPPFFLSSSPDKEVFADIYMYDIPFSHALQKVTKWVGKAAALVVIIAELRLRISMSRHVHNTTQLPPSLPFSSLPSPPNHMWSTVRCETFVWELICELLSVHSESQSQSASESESESESQSECECECEWPVWIEGNWMLSNMWMTFAVGRPLNVS